MTTNNELRIEATRQHGDDAYYVTAYVQADTCEALEALQAKFPKYVGFYISGVSSTRGTYWDMSARFRLMPVQGNTKNEAGAKRLRAVLRVAAANDITVVEPMGYTNSVPLAEALATN